MQEETGRTLLSQQEEGIWKIRHQRLGESRKLAGIFRGWVPQDFASSKPKILYVGKATSGPFNGVDVERDSFNKGGMFWRFAKQSARSVNCSEESLACIAWSNISKISYPQVKAEASLLAGFEEDAASTLETEIGHLEPDIVVFVTGHFSDQVVGSVAASQDDTDWNKSESESTLPEEADVWWRRRPDGVAVLWMRHPLFAKPQLLAFAAAKIASLTLTKSQLGAIDK